MLLKKDIIRMLAKRVNCTMLDAELFYNNVIDVLEDVILKSGFLRLPFGAFVIKTRKGKRIYNISTQDYMMSDDINTLTFKVNPRMKSLVRYGRTGKPKEKEDPVELGCLDPETDEE